MTPKQYDPEAWKAAFLAALHGTGRQQPFKDSDGEWRDWFDVDAATGHAYEIADEAVIILSDEEWEQSQDAVWFLKRKGTAQ